VPLFQRKSRLHERDPFQVVMGYIGALAEQRARESDAVTALAGVDVTDILDALGLFATMLKSNLTEEDRQVIRSELAAVQGSDEMRAAVVDLGEALLVQADGVFISAAYARHWGALQSSGGAVRMAVELVHAMARAARKMEVEFKWG
jgi:hypothetical protein